MYALYRRRRQVPRRPGDERDRQPRCRSSSPRASGPRSRPPTCCCASPAPSPRRCSAAARAIAARDRPRPRLGVRARGRLRLRRAGARLLRRIGRHRRSRRRRCSACSRAPHYFRRLGKGNFRKAPEEIVKAALLGIERKRQVAAQVDAWAERARRRHLPAADARAALPHPVQARQERARVQGRRRGVAAHRPAAARAAEGGRRDRLALRVPLAPLPVREVPARHRLRAGRRCRRSKEELPLAPARGVLDRRLGRRPRSTTRCRCRASAAARVTVGIHIAAPALAIAPRLAGRPDRPRPPVHGLHPGPQADDAARRRGRRLHARRGPRGAGASRSTSRSTRPRSPRSRRETRIERILIAANLRHDKLESEVNEATLAAGLPATLPFAAELTFLHGLARHLKARREKVRGKPETFNRPDYSFRVDTRDGAAIVGDERVRDRAAPARLAARPDRRRGDDPGQQHLGRLARRPAACPAIYRSQAEPGARRQGAHGHAGRRRTPAWASPSTPGRPRRCAATSTW